MRSNKLKVSSVMRFLCQFIRHPNQVGAIVPSGHSLCKHIAKTALQGLQQPDGYILELGPGTGVVTQALINGGAHADKIICVENNPKFIISLQKQFSHSTIIADGAENIRSILTHKNIEQVPVIISSLPLLSLPSTLRLQVIQAITQCLVPGGTLVQFTYGLPSPYRGFHQLLQPVHKKLIICNMPPAFVWEYKRSDVPAAPPSSSPRTS